MQGVIHCCGRLQSARSRLFSTDALHMKTFFHSRLSFRQLPNNNRYKFHQTRLFNPSVSLLCDSRFFHSHHDFQRNNALQRKDSSLFYHATLPKCQTIPSVSLHTPSSVNFKALEELPTLKTSNCNGVNVGLLNLGPSPTIRSQIRYLHNHTARRRRVNRTCSSRENSSTPSEQKKHEEKEPEEDSEKQLTLYQRFKKTYREHGKVLVAVHCITSAGWFGSFYLAARCGVDIVPLLENWNLSEKVISPFRSGGLGDVALAYLMYKLATPARYTVTIGGTNLAIRYLKKEGKIQPVAKEDTLREMYKEGKADLKTKGINTRSRLRNMRGRIQGRIRTRLRNMRGRIQEGRIRRGRKRR